MADIFISHIHEDEVAASALKRLLLAKFKVARLHPAPEIFVSSNQLQIGDEWLDKIRSSLKSAKVVIALFSPQAIERPWVNFEAGGAWFGTGKTLMPLCIGGLHPANLPKPYSNIQGAILSDSLTPYYLLEAVWRALNLSNLIPPPFYEQDDDVREFMNELGRWEVMTRAREAIRRTEELMKRAEGK